MVSTEMGDRFGRVYNLDMQPGQLHLSQLSFNSIRGRYRVPILIGWANTG